MENEKPFRYGQVREVKLADGNIYILREPDAEMLTESDLDLSKMNEIKNVKKLAWIMMKHDNEGLTEEKVSRLLTVRTLREKGEFIDALIELYSGGN